MIQIDMNIQPPLAEQKLPETMEELRVFALSLQTETRIYQAELYAQALHIEKLKMQLAALRRARFGQSSEKLDQEIEQMELMLEEMEEGQAQLAGKREHHADLSAPCSDDVKETRVAKARQLQELENKGDAILGELLVELFRNSTDPRDLILRKDIYDMLEKVIDRYRDAAGVALQIVLKHS